MNRELNAICDLTTPPYGNLGALSAAFPINYRYDCKADAQATATRRLSWISGNIGTQPNLTIYEQAYPNFLCQLPMTLLEFRP